MLDKLIQDVGFKKVSPIDSINGATFILAIK